MPLLLKNFWHTHEKTILISTATLSIGLGYLLLNDYKEILYESIVIDYIPFIIMLFALYTLSNGIHIKIKAVPTTLNNVLFLLICSIFSSLIGTTGASMLFLRPFLEMNSERKNKSHLIIFFIFLVSNIGGLLSPLGDPPLLLGYLHGVEFLWFAKNLTPSWIIYVSVCLTVLSVIDFFVLKKEKFLSEYQKPSIEISGILNIILIISSVFVLFINLDFSILLFNLEIPPIGIKNIILLFFCIISKMYANKSEKIDYAPFKEVARTFLVIFIVIAPVLFILSENSTSIQEFMHTISKGKDQSFIYFWLCGTASSFLDNAPSYLLFFNMAGGNPDELMYTYANILKSISVSSVVMGSMTYIGNAPNMMVRAISEKQGVKMPSFIGYMLWSGLIILPASIIISLLN